MHQGFAEFSQIRDLTNCETHTTAIPWLGPRLGGLIILESNWREFTGFSIPSNPFLIAQILFPAISKFAVFLWENGGF